MGVSAFLSIAGEGRGERKERVGPELPRSREEKRESFLSNYPYGREERKEHCSSS